MKTIRYHLSLWSTAACVVLMSGFASADEGVVRISDQSAAGSSAAPGVAYIRPVSFQGAGCTSGDLCCAPQGCSAEASCCVPSMPCGDNCGETCCEGCYTGCPNPECRNDCCMCQNCCCHGRMQCGYMDGHQSRMNCLFAGSACSGSGNCCHDFFRGQSLSFAAKNSRLADHLFGWMVPSGCCGKGCPPVGKYGITYADQPEYIDPRDTQLYAAQGYGMPMTVPLAPNVRYSYNYSAGMPASRVTQISNYNPMTSAQPLYHQSW